MLKALILLAAFISVAFGQCNSEGQMVTTSVGSACACYSGFGGNDCQSALDGVCSNAPTVAAMNTTAIAELVNYMVADDYFSFGVQSPAYNQRYFQDISIQGNASCAYPVASTFFSHEYDSASCEDLYNGNFSIPDLIGCGFTASPAGNDWVVSGRISVTAVDSLGTFRTVNLYRTTSSVLNVAISIPQTVTVNTSSPITVLSAVNPLYAVTQQTYDPSNGGTITIVVTASLQYPYQFESTATVGSDVQSGTATVTANTNGCPATGNCFQDATFVINNVNTICNISGAYTFTFQATCRTGYSNCPLPDPVPETAVANIVADNACATVTVYGNIQGSLAPYSDKTFQTEQMVFVAGQPMFFQATFTSDVTIQTVALENLIVVQSGMGNQFVVQSGDFNSDYNNGDYSGYGFENDAFTFAIMADVGDGSNYLFNSNGNLDDIFQFEVYAEFMITYKTTFGRRRNMESTKMTMSTRGVLDGSRVWNDAKGVAVDAAEEAVNSGYKAAATAVPFIFAAAGYAANANL